MIEFGEFVVVIGNNGVGKLILFNMIVGMLNMDVGEIILVNYCVINCFVVYWLWWVVWVF